jgi:hypothetical protein
LNIDGPHRIPEQEGRKRHAPPQKPTARLATDDFIMSAEEPQWTVKCQKPSKTGPAQGDLKD